MAASGAPARTPRRGPAPIASFDHDNSDESSPESKQAIRLPEIREDPSCSSASIAAGDSLAPPEQRARSHSTPAASGLQTPAAPRIEFSRASSSSHQDSRDSSPELALFAGTTSTGEDARSRLELGFREDGALDLRSSTEELAFLEPAPGEPRSAPPPPSAERRHSRKDSQGSEAALLAVSGRTSRLSSIGSQCSAHSALSGFSHASHVSRLSVVSGVSRSPSPHRMLLETSFCGPKPIETDPEICAAAVEESLLEMAKLSSATVTTPVIPVTAPVDARDRREVRTEVTVERASSRTPSINVRQPSQPVVPSVPTAPTVTVTITTSSSPIAQSITTVASPPLEVIDGDKREKESKNRAKVERRARSRDRRESRDPEVKRSANRSKDIIRIRLKPDSEYEDDDDEDESERTLVGGDQLRKPASLALGSAARPSDAARTSITSAKSAPNATSPTPSRHRGTRDSRTPSPAGPVVSRKSSFCSLFKSRETIASPDSPSDALRRKKSITDGRSRSRSRDRSATPTSAAKIRGSVLSLFKTPRKSATSPSPSSRDGSPVVQPQRQIVQPVVDKRRTDRLKYYEDAKDGIIHIPLRTPPDELDGAGTSGVGTSEVSNHAEVAGEVTHREASRPSSAPVTSTRPAAPATTARPSTTASTACPSSTAATARVPSKPVQRTVLPDGSIIIPLHSPTEKKTEQFPEVAVVEKTLEDKHETSCDSVQSTSKSIVSPSTSWQESKLMTSEVNTVAPVDTVPATKAQSERAKRKERIMFSTHVGSRDQVFSTQFSITKTPSVTSEISESFPSFTEPQADEVRTPTLRDTHITSTELPTPTPGEDINAGSVVRGSSIPSLLDAARDSSESEPSSETAPPRSGNDVEQRGLVVQESFEEELPYVPTTLPLERSLALPMVPVRERGGVLVAPLRRPRAAAPRHSLAGPGVPGPPPLPQPGGAAGGAAGGAEGAGSAARKLRIKLPRARTASAPARARAASDGYEGRAKSEWIDFEEVPERRKQPTRIQTLPAPAVGQSVCRGSGLGESGFARNDGNLCRGTEPILDHDK
ncbi:serine/arginine repetitive matrix protein 1 [Amyelois transitella]|uniref:serine/arginine repetitive matrix protein 1 n=1 Tax=Amyelois transitella TaxID=680683 RepID=UPI00299021CC|nr:serine/arginine repetitive matrix protein 1 [Amyelois transitella]